MANWLLEVLPVIFSEYGLIALLFVLLLAWVLKTTNSREERLMKANDILLTTNKELLDSNKTILDTNKSLCDKIDVKLDLLLDTVKNK